MNVLKVNDTKERLVEQHDTISNLSTSIEVALFDEGGVCNCKRTIETGRLSIFCLSSFENLTLDNDLEIGYSLSFKTLGSLLLSQPIALVLSLFK